MMAPAVALFTPLIFVPSIQTSFPSVKPTLFKNKPNFLNTSFSSLLCTFLNVAIVIWPGCICSITPETSSHTRQANFCFSNVQMQGSFCSSRMASLAQQRYFRFFEKICFEFFKEAFGGTEPKEAPYEITGMRCEVLKSKSPNNSLECLLSMNYSAYCYYLA